MAGLDGDVDVVVRFQVGEVVGGNTEEALGAGLAGGESGGRLVVEDGPG